MVSADGHERDRRHVDERHLAGHPASTPGARPRARGGCRRAARRGPTVVLWLETTPKVMPRVKPSERSTANSPRRRRTDVTSTWARVETASTTRNTTSTLGTLRTRLRFSSSGGTSAGAIVRLPSDIERSSPPSAPASSTPLAPAQRAVLLHPVCASKSVAVADHPHRLRRDPEPLGEPRVDLVREERAARRS